MMAKAAASAADHVFLDLEDAVAPSMKDSARGMVIDALHSLDWSGKVRCVRVNDLASPHFIDDVSELVAKAGTVLDTIMVPKVMTPADLQFVDRLLGMLETRAGLQRQIGIEILIEEVPGLLNVDSICAASPRLEAAVLGVGDYSASQRIDRRAINGHPDYPGDLWHYARFKLVVACRANGVQAIDGPFVDLKNLDGYRRQAREAALLGFDGKWALHPDQIAVALDEFSPSAEEVRFAREVSGAFAAHESQGVGAFSHNGLMVDVALVRLLRNTLLKADLFGM
ncbi:Citrate lyase [Paraburkholderia xenovorans LB400]|uniref:Citrate lyase n=2 Tax=Paraburkholderia xenovorans TaxID=36873 RepID=Q13GS8_PARXL|nr:Citrate lyase [Paraburkholderia xenovorans LB400]